MKNVNKMIMAAASAALIMALAACGSAASPVSSGTATPMATASSAAGGDMYAATETAKPSAAVTPTAAAGATASATPAPTASAKPSVSAAPSATPAPTPTPAPSATPQPAAAGPVSAEASNWKWTLSQTEFKAGEAIHFQAVSKQGVHGFSIVGTGVNVIISPGETQDVTWTPDKPGEYTIKCSQFCGTGHSAMETKIIVK